MKKSLLIVSIVLSGINFSSAQSMDVLPFSSVDNIAEYEKGLPTISLPSIDMVQVANEDAEGDKTGTVTKFSRSVYTNINLQSAGAWSTLPNGDRVWRIRVSTPDAQALIPYFNDFYIPEGGRLHIYNDDKTDMLGAFTSINNSESRMFATWFIHSSSMILEYYEPVNVSGQGVISLNEIGYCYRHIDNELTPPPGRGLSDACEVDVNCPEGTAWVDQRDGTCRILVKIGAATGYCSGSLINNTAQDCKNYILTALHCGLGTQGNNSTIASTSDFNQWVFRFNFQKSGCGTGTNSGNNGMTGCTLRAHSNDGGGDTGSDFLLVQLNSVTGIPATYNVYYVGWDRNSTPNPSNGVGIHHPAGDYKKISTYSSTTSGTWGGTSGTHWRFAWIATTTNWGVTEGGSSGSPMFNSAKRQVGTLTGGGSFCTAQTAQDYYGKFSYHWASNGTGTNRRLESWLDPTTSGATNMDGRRACPAAVGEIAIDDIFNVYPNPSTGKIMLDITSSNNQTLYVTVYNTFGQLVRSERILVGVKTHSIDLTAEAAGVYIVNVKSGNQFTSKKVLIEK